MTPPPFINFIKKRRRNGTWCLPSLSVVFSMCLVSLFVTFSTSVHRNRSLKLFRPHKFWEDKRVEQAFSYILYFLIFLLSRPLYLPETIVEMFSGLTHFVGNIQIDCQALKAPQTRGHLTLKV